MGRLANYIYWLFLRLFGTKRVYSSSVSRKAQIGEQVLVRQGVKVGAGCVIGDYSYLSGPGTIFHSGTIGKFCSIALDVKIGLDEHDHQLVSTHPFLYSSSFGGFVEQAHSVQDRSPPVIGDDVWIGVGATILRGVSVGKGAVIGAGSVVVSDVPPYSIVAGIPAKVIKYRFDPSVIEQLLRIDWQDWPQSEIKENIRSFYDVKQFVSDFGGSPRDRN